jgi:hypothetical protein
LFLHLDFKVLDCKVELVNQPDPFGLVKSSELEITGSTLPTRLIMESSVRKIDDQILAFSNPDVLTNIIEVEPTASFW